MNWSLAIGSLLVAFPTINVIGEEFHFESDASVEREVIQEKL